jgi:hypothetical protein
LTDELFRQVADVDDVNDMDESIDTAHSGRGIDRRTMLKAAVVAGTFAGTWVAPRIESLGFSPAAAAGTPCIILSPASDDKNANSAQNYCPISTKPCCGQSFGSNGQIDRFTFTNPAPNCSQIVVRTIALDCNANNSQPQRNPDVGQFAVIIESATGSGCGVCTILDAVLLDTSHRTILESLNNGPVACPPAGPIGNGVDASIACNDPNLASSARLAVRLSCVTGVPGCTTTP